MICMSNRAEQETDGARIVKGPNVRKDDIRTEWQEETTNDSTGNKSNVRANERFLCKLPDGLRVGS
jgi:hypothetical protein